MPRERQRNRKAAGTFAAFSAESAVIGMEILVAAKIAMALIKVLIVPCRHKQLKNNMLSLSFVHPYRNRYFSNLIKGKGRAIYGATRGIALNQRHSPKMSF